DRRNFIIGAVTIANSFFFVALGTLVAISLFFVVLEPLELFGHFMRNFYIGACLEDDFVVASAIVCIFSAVQNSISDHNIILP
ncbi:12981_t:CDS:2, partial [Gigaspora rosea]